jgi:hypothetical protein
MSCIFCRSLAQAVQKSEGLHSCNPVAQDPAKHTAMVDQPKMGSYVT